MENIGINEKLILFKNVLGFRLSSISALTAVKRQSVNEIELVEWTYLYFWNLLGGMQIIKLRYRGYDAVSEFENPSHGILFSETNDEEIKANKFHEGFYLNMDTDFFLKKVTIWSDAHKELEFEKICDVLVLEFSNHTFLLFQLSDSSEADLYIENTSVEDFFKRYPDYEEREIILLGQVE
jgi:hypothetical protein